MSLVIIGLICRRPNARRQPKYRIYVDDGDFVKKKINFVETRQKRSRWQMPRTPNGFRESGIIPAAMQHSLSGHLLFPMRELGLQVFLAGLSTDHPTHPSCPLYLGAFPAFSFFATKARPKREPVPQDARLQGNKAPWRARKAFLGKSFRIKARSLALSLVWRGLPSKVFWIFWGWRPLFFQLSRVIESMEVHRFGNHCDAKAF